MKLRDILSGIDYELRGDIDTEVSSICYDSRKAGENSLFFCIVGFAVDGHNYAAAAVKNGASAIVVTRFLEDIDAAQILVKNDRQAMALISANFYGNPAKKMKMIGVTGTKGKTSTTYMLKAILEAAGEKVGLIGTIYYMIGEKTIPAKHTTPEAPDLQALLAEMQASGMTSVVMEVSSSALIFERVYGMRFDAAVYTNLSQDHMDIHGDFDNYAAAKQILFKNADISIGNIDDPRGRFMLEGADKKKFTYAIEQKADYRAYDIELSSQNSRFMLETKDFRMPLYIELPGKFMVYNALAAVSCCLELGIDLVQVKRGLEAIHGVPGRFEKLDTKGMPYTIILDYAHTPDSLENILTSVKLFAKGRIVCLFGCGGNRDNTKRPLMGAVTEKYADLAIVTTDNPRFEEPADIIAQITAGMTSDRYIVIENRLEAIRYAIENAKKDDVIILAGKGHEYYQEIKGVRYDFNEKEIVEEIMQEITNK